MADAFTIVSVNSDAADSEIRMQRMEEKIQQLEDNTQTVDRWQILC
jgi:hypothetical protein